MKLVDLHTHTTASDGTDSPALLMAKAAEAGLAQAVAARRAECWLAENQAALESSNAYAETHGLPLARYRTF